MSKDLHVSPKLPLQAGQKWNKATSCLTLDKAGKFTVTVPDFEKYIDSIYSKPKPFTPVKEEVFNNMTRDSKAAYKKKFDDYNEAEDAYKKNITKERANIKWAWQLVHKGIDPSKIIHNNSFSLGISTINEKQITFPKLLEGGGLTWLEIFTENNPPIGKPPHGMFMRAIGTPKVISAEWRDYQGKLITEEIAFGSTVYLHIYTQALYEEKIEVQLRDTKFVNAVLVPTPSDQDGNPIQKLEPEPLTRFQRRVSVHKYDESTKPPAGTITDAIITEKGKDQISSSNVQKCVFPVFVEQAWQFQAAGNFDSGSKLSINPIVYHDKIEDQKIDLDDCVLKVSKEGILMQGELSGNNPLMLGEAGGEENDAPEDQNKIDFTFGVFIDGTNNNRYDSIARIDWEKKQIRKLETKDNAYNSAQHLKVHAKSDDELSDKDKEKYKYGEGSYENDLSNVAILFDNYVENTEERIFKIYTEGMNTNTLGDENLNVSEYKKDDLTKMGGIFGTGNSGIIDRVRRAVDQVAKKIKVNDDQKIGCITVDVFGFSRGAASARHFVHSITYPAYYATMGLKSAYCDHQGYPVSEEYHERKKILPKSGYLGYLLTEKGIKFDKLIIRFVGIYDTVAHHGMVQYNDIRDLGLNSVSKAKYIVHMVAAEEHRKNFSISPIIKNQNHVELYMPGVHCDVGGSYTEGRPEGIAPNVPPDPSGEHVIADDYCDNTIASQKLSKFRNTLINEGWYTKDQIKICDAFGKTYKYDPIMSSLYDTQQLISQRAYISNQYSFIPLHIMKQFAENQSINFNNTTLGKYVFTKNVFSDNVDFLNKIKKHLEDYGAKAFANPLEVINHTIPEADLRQLRNHYLHYNATVGIVNGPEPERKRGIVQS